MQKTSQEFFRRKLYSRMLAWKKRDGASALLIQGARRVGKSALAVEFARREYRSYLLIDFSVAAKKVKDLFNDISDPGFLFLRLQAIYRVQLFERESVIIFDEVQEAPLARQAIKHLVEDRRYDYIETGTSISARKNTIGILIPSEETKLTLYPMDFEEFRWALGDTVTIPLLRTAFEKRLTLGETAHRKMMRDFRIYMLTGGMPQAVRAYLETNRFGTVDAVKREILSVYSEDFGKLDRRGRAGALFDAIAQELRANAVRYQVAKAIPGEKPGRVARIVKALGDSMAVNVTYHADDPDLSLALTKDTERFKLYAADTGLLVTLAFKGKDATGNPLYCDLFSESLSAVLSFVYRNAIAQMLRASGKELFYHAFPVNGGKKRCETDFLFADGDKIVPVEINSSGYRTHASLDAFCKRHADRILSKYLIYTGDLHCDQDVCCLPVYMTPFI